MRALFVFVLHTCVVCFPAFLKWFNSWNLSHVNLGKLLLSRSVITKSFFLKFPIRANLSRVASTFILQDLASASWAMKPPLLSASQFPVRLVLSSLWPKHSVWIEATFWGIRNKKIQCESTTFQHKRQSLINFCTFSKYDRTKHKNTIRVSIECWTTLWQLLSFNNLYSAREPAVWVNYLLFIHDM